MSTCFSLLGSLVLGAIAGAAPPPDLYSTNAVQVGCSTNTIKVEINSPYTWASGTSYYRVSGTSCHFTVSRTSDAHDPAIVSVTATEVYIGTEKLTLSSTFLGKIRWASTHVDDANDDLTLKFRAKFQVVCPTHGDAASENWLEVTYHVDPYNKGGAYEIGQFALNGTGGQAADTCFENANHYHDFERGTGWDVNDIGNRTSSLWSAIHIGSHGFSDGRIQYDTDPATFFDANDVHDWRDFAESAGVPPINLAFFDCCDVGQSTTPEMMLEPTGGSIIDRAAVAFTVVVNAEASVLGCTGFYEQIEIKKTAEQALAKYVQEYNDFVAQYNQSNSGDDLPILDSSDAKIIGDKKTRLVGVYTGTALLPSSTWYTVVAP